MKGPNTSACEASRRLSSCPRRNIALTSKRPSIVDHILAGEPWPDDLVDAINDRPHGPDRQIDF